MPTAPNAAAASAPATASRSSWTTISRTTPVGPHPAHAQVSGEEQGASIRRQRRACRRRASTASRSPTRRRFSPPGSRISTTSRTSPTASCAKLRRLARARRPVLHRVARHGRLSAERRPQRAFRRQWQRNGRRQDARQDSEPAMGPRRDRGALGKGAPRVFTLTTHGGRGSPRRFSSNLPFAGSDFSELHWLGFSSTASADTAFYLDNLTIKRRP